MRDRRQFFVDKEKFVAYGEISFNGKSFVARADIEPSDRYPWRWDIVGNKIDFIQF